MRFRTFHSFRTYHLLIPTCAFSLFPFPHVQSADPYMRFQPLPIFRMYYLLIPTCAFGFLPLSASYRFPHVQLADFYLCFRFPPIFCMYGLLIPTCAFGFLPLSARTTRRFLPAVSTSSRLPHVLSVNPYMQFRSLPRFPHVLPVNSYLRFRTFHSFRTYNLPIPTCAFGLSTLSARTTRRFLPALSTSPCLPHVPPADSYLRFRPHPVFRTYTPPIPTCVSDHAASFARTPRQSLPALSVSSHFPHVRLAHHMSDLHSLSEILKQKLR